LLHPPAHLLPEIDLQRDALPVPSKGSWIRLKAQQAVRRLSRPFLSSGREVPNAGFAMPFDQDAMVSNSEKLAGSLRTSELPPIRPLSIEEFEIAVKNFVSSLGGWEPGESSSEAWTMRLTASASVSRNHAFHTDVENCTNAAYFVGELPVGLMSFGKKRFAGGQTYPWVHTIVTHPGSEGVGGALIEYVVNSMKPPGQDVLRLSARESARPAYAAMGFKPVKGSSAYMELNPKDSNKWVENGGWLVLAKHAEKSYVNYLGSL
jgi:hypothetical protein